MTRSELYAWIKAELETTRPMLSMIMQGVDEYADECLSPCCQELDDELYMGGWER